MLYPIAWGQAMPEAAQADAEAHDDDPQAGIETDLPIAIPPMADINFLVSFDPHDGHGIILSRSPVTSSSKTFSHFSQRYSKIGIQTPSFHP